MREDRCGCCVGVEGGRDTGLKRLCSKGVFVCWIGCGLPPVANRIISGIKYFVGAMVLTLTLRCGGGCSEGNGVEAGATWRYSGWWTDKAGCGEEEALMSYPPICSVEGGAEGGERGRGGTTSS